MTPIVGAKTSQKAAERRKRRTTSRSTSSSRSTGAATELMLSPLVGPETDQVVDHPDQQRDVDEPEPPRDPPVPLVDPGKLVVADLLLVLFVFVLVLHHRLLARSAYFAAVARFFG